MAQPCSRGWALRAKQNRRRGGRRGPPVLSPGHLGLSPCLSRLPVSDAHTKAWHVMSQGPARDQAASLPASLVLNSYPEHQVNTCFPNAPITSRINPMSLAYWSHFIKGWAERGLPGGPVAKTPSSKLRGPRFDAWLGKKILHVPTKEPACHNEGPVQSNK